VVILKTMVTVDLSRKLVFEDRRGREEHARLGEGAHHARMI
jgi:hypothetical protein